MKVSIVVIGDELLLGQVTDTNSGFIARTIAPAAWSVAAVETVADDADSILGAIERGFERADVVLTTGGLGPTKDDITKSVLCSYFGGTLKLDPDVLANVEQVMARRGREINELTRTQAIVPDSCRVIQNLVGTAPIMWFERDGKTLVAMPGVPFETEQMFTSAVFPSLLEKYAENTTIAHRYLMVTDLSESRIAEDIASIEDALPPFLHIAYLPNPGYVRLRIDGHNRDAALVNRELDNAVSKIKECLGDTVLWDEDLTPAALLLKLLDRHGLTVATAESCTGGNIAHQITLIPGSSSAMKGGVVAYSNEVKMNLLGVSPKTLDTHGAVSIPVVEQMVTGTCKALGADVALATSGIAGPGGGTPEKPVGTVCIAVKCLDKTVSCTRHFAGNRSRVINHSTDIALILAIKLLKGL